MENYLDFNFLSRKAHENAVNHGFWDERLSAEHRLMLIFTEIAEAMEADRKCRHANMSSFERFGMGDDTIECFESYIKDTVEDGMADVMICLADLAGAEGMDFDKLLPSRYLRTFGNYSFAENAYGLVKGLCKEDIYLHKRLQWALQYVRSWADYLHINLAWHIEHKMKYNSMREQTHGKSY